MSGAEPYTTCDDRRLHQALVPWERASDGFGAALDRATSAGTAPSFEGVTAPAPVAGGT